MFTRIIWGTVSKRLGRTYSSLCFALHVGSTTNYIHRGTTSGNAHIGEQAPHRGTGYISGYGLYIRVPAPCRGSRMYLSSSVIKSGISRAEMTMIPLEIEPIMMTCHLISFATQSRDSAQMQTCTCTKLNQFIFVDLTL